jgi:F-type H+-transporting ATPase subunit delta
VAASDVQTYAQALYETLIGKGIEQLRAVAPKVAEIDPRAKDVQKQIEAVLPADALPEVKNFLLVLVREGALDRIETIVGTLESYGKTGLLTAPDTEVISAVNLTDTQQNHITSELRRRYGEGLAPNFKVDETLIGGLIIRVGDQVLDNSLRSRLGNIQRSMLVS